VGGGAVSGGVCMLSTIDARQSLEFRARHQRTTCDLDGLQLAVLHELEEAATADAAEQCAALWDWVSQPLNTRSSRVHLRTPLVGERWSYLVRTELCGVGRGSVTIGQVKLVRLVSVPSECLVVGDAAVSTV